VTEKNAGLRPCSCQNQDRGKKADDQLMALLAKLKQQPAPALFIDYTGMLDFLINNNAQEVI
jgi:hypothetical protein